MRHLPLFLDVRGAPVLLVGGGTVAAGKLRMLRAAGALVTVVAPQINGEIAAAQQSSGLRHLRERFVADHVRGQRLIIAATNDRNVNQAVAAAAAEHAIWVNVVDDAVLSNCIVPAIVDRAPLLIAISSGGAAPMLARWARARIELLFDNSIGPLATLLASWRARILQQVPGPALRRELYDALLNGDAAALVRTGRFADADAALASSLRASGSTAMRSGRVALVGAGPGDPGLLTLNALRALQRADVILHDQLVSTEVLALARRDAELIDVGKAAGSRSTAQRDIHRLMIEQARAGRFVVRLKGGDALLFARGGEELQELRRAGIAFEVIPGITTAVAAGAYAGIPLTHRELAQGVRLLTAHVSAANSAPDWCGWARTTDTLALYMGLAQCKRVSQQLRQHGRDAATPVALIENVSRPQQRVVLGRLDQLGELARAHALCSPTLVIIGEVAGLASQLHWFGAAPSLGMPAVNERAA